MTEAAPPLSANGLPPEQRPEDATYFLDLGREGMEEALREQEAEEKSVLPEEASSGSPETQLVPRSPPPLPPSPQTWLQSLLEEEERNEASLVRSRIPKDCLPSVERMFAEHSITTDYLLHVEKEDWREDAKEMGIRSIGHRFALWRGMQRLRQEAAEFQWPEFGGAPALLQAGSGIGSPVAAGKGAAAGEGGAIQEPVEEEKLESEMEQGAPDVMISLNVGSMKQVAINLYNHLTALNYRVWVCVQMEAGDAFRIEIAKSAGQCKAFVILLNDAWCASKECEYEFNVATRKNLTRGTPHILPIVMGGALFGVIGEKYPAVDAMLCNTNALVLEKHEDPEERSKIWSDLVKTLGRRGVPQSLGRKDSMTPEGSGEAAGGGPASPSEALPSQQEQLEGLKLQFFLNAALGNVGMLEAMLGNPDNVKLGLHVNVVSDRNDTALTFAARGPNMALVSMRKNPYKGMQDVALHWYQQIKSDPSLLSRTQPDGSRRYDTPKTAAWLLARGADIHVVNHSGDNALSSACRGGQSHVVPILLANGARAVVNRRGMNLLACALENNPNDMTSPCTPEVVEQLCVAFPQLRRPSPTSPTPKFGRSLTGHG